MIVSNAVALHPVVNRRAQAKLRWMIPPTARAIGYLDPQWGNTGAPWVLPKAVTAWVRLTHRECTNTVCRLASFTYGTGHADAVAPREPQRRDARVAARTSSPPAR